MYNSSNEERDKELEIVKAVAKQHRANPFVFFWSQQADQQKMQDNLGIEHVFPSLAMYIPGRNKAATFHGKFEQQEISDWLQDLVDGKMETFMP